jgi:hypothetical protein
MKSLSIYLKIIGFVVLQTAVSYAMKPGEVPKIPEGLGQPEETSQVPTKKQKTLAEGGIAREETVPEVIVPVDVPGTLGKIEKPFQFFFVSLLNSVVMRY